MGCAVVAARLASKVQNVSPLSAFTAGFVHDVGKVLLYRYSKERFIAALSVALEKNAKQSAGKLAILVVEDHTSLCDLLSLYLMRHGYHLRTASNGEGALEILSKEEIHLVLLDLMLPRVDGFEVLRQIHKSQHDKTPYIIVVSAGASEKDRKKVLELGANEYMPKPFHLMRLPERIQIVEKYSL